MGLRPEAAGAGPRGLPLTEVALLVVAGVGAGLCGSVAGLASVVSYPALLAVGLSPLAANVTNTTAMFATTVGAAAGSRPELRGQGRRLGVLCAQAAVGGTVGAALLLGLPERAFEVVVPWLIALGAVLLLARDRLRRWARRSPPVPGNARRRPRRLGWGAAVTATGCYGGYFGAGAGIIMLAVLSLRDEEPLAVTNAVKNVATGCANLTATVAFLFLAPVDLAAAGAVALGALVGSWLGPSVVRVLPERPLRYAVAGAGLLLAASLL